MRERAPRGGWGLAASLLLLALAASGPAAAKKDSGSDLVAPLASVARKVAAAAPGPAWSTILPAAEADLIQFVSASRVLVGEVGIAPGTPFLPLASAPHTGPVALYDAETGRKIWSHARPPLPPGQYSVLAVSPVILLVATEAKRAVYTALDPETGKTRWEQAFRAPYSAVPSPDGEHLVVTSGGWVTRKLSAVSIGNGSVLWERSLDPDVLSKDRPPLLTPAGSILVVAGKSVLGLEPRTGEDLWSVPSPLSGEDAVSAAAWGDGILVAGKSRVAHLDAATGAVRWSRGFEGATVRTALPSDGAALVGTRATASDERAPVRDALSALGAGDGGILWRKDEEEIRSPLLLSGSRVSYTTESAVLCRDVSSGDTVFRTEVGGKFGRWGRSEGFRWLLPDLLEMRGDAIVVARETFGVLKVSIATGKVLFAHETDREKTSRYGFDARASDLFGAYWSGQMNTLDAAEERFRAVMSGLLEGAGAAAQAIAGTSAVVARAQAPAAGLGPGTTGPSPGDEQTRREIAAYDRAIAREIDAGRTLADPKYQALAAGRGLARESLGQASQARIAVLGAEKAQVSVLASMDSMMATIEFCTSVMSFLDGLSSSIREAAGLRKYVDLRHSVELHRSSIQQRFYTRPFEQREARGTTVVDLITGERTDFLFSVQDDFFVREIGVDLPRAAEAPGGTRIVTRGIALDPAAYETYKVGLFKLPRPSLLAFDVETLLRTPPVAEFDLVEAAASGDLASVRTLLAAGASPETRDDQGNGAMVRAAKGGHAEVVRALLAAGARLDVPDGKNNLPFGQAILDGQAGVVAVLLEAGADIAAFDPHGQAPLCWAVVSGRPDVVRALLARGADVRRMHATHPPDVILKDANLIRGLCADDACRARFDETIALVREALGE